ncbi:MAG: hypothetical protein GY835_01485 [bacterium]|nr:hypothetical protein [bacterium]
MSDMTPYNPLSPDNAEHEELLHRIARITDEPVAVVHRRVGDCIDDLRDELDCLIGGDTTGPIVQVSDSRVTVDITRVRQIADALSITSSTIQWCLHRILNVISVDENGAPDEGQANAVVHLFIALAPKDSTDAILTAEALCTDILTERFARLLSRSKGHPSSDRMVKPYCNLIRAKISILEQRDKRRRGPSVQRVVVERVEVSQGGQAIVGAVDGGEGGE